MLRIVLCYPKDIIITEASAEVKLQSLLDHTVERFFSCSNNNILKNLNLEPTNLTMFYKWGCDGASGQSTYKQIYSKSAEDVPYDDAFLFVISLVPLQLKNNEEVLWQNPRPSSTRYCRSIKFLFAKETAELTRSEIDKVQEQIQTLYATKVYFQSKEILVNHKMLLTMVDGKVCSVLANKSFQKCYICGAVPKEMNNLASHSTTTIDSTTLTFGLSSLHSWIRCFECLLHIAYRLEVKTWQIRKNDKESVEKRKKIIQDRFRQEMGLLVNVPKPGYGTTNDGNTARKCFSESFLSASITGIDEELIKRFAIILRTICSGYEIDLEKFETYTLDTAKLYIQLYNWYYMPASVHKLLIHSRQIVESALLPIGQLSEEAQEARNKDCRRFREHHTRKISRESNVQDLMHMLLITSDPLITNFRKLSPKKIEKISEDLLLKNPPQNVEELIEEEENSNEEFSSSSSDEI